VDHVAYARGQMAVSLVFHIVFAAIGIALPLALFVADGLFLLSGRREYRRLSAQWSRATAMLFAIGAISGTALSFELGLLWPRFTKIMGPAVGHAFALEGFAFFIEAIFIGLYLYGRPRLSRVAHWLCAGVVALSGAASGVLVLAVNAWMQIPVGFELGPNDTVTRTNPSQIFGTYAWWSMSVHSTLSCYAAIPFAMAGIYALGRLRGQTGRYTRAGIAISMTIGGIAAILQPLSGDALAKFVYQTQPAKFAAMEGQFETMRRAPLHIGGFPDMRSRTNRFAIEIPGGLSFLANHDLDAKVVGLNAIPEDRWPNVPLVHTAFDLMVGCGMAMALAALLFWAIRWRRGPAALNGRKLLWMLVITSPMGIIALEAGWFVTEVGRQPWVIQGVLLTKDAAATSQSLPVFFYGFGVFYLGLASLVIVLLRSLARRGSVGLHT